MLKHFHNKNRATGVKESLNNVKVTHQQKPCHNVLINVKDCGKVLKG